MAPVDVLYRLKETYFGHHAKDKPIIQTRTAAFLSAVFTLLYVLPFYISATTRPSPTLNRDAPSVIRARIRTVTLACVIASAATLYVLLVLAKADVHEALHLLGWWPIQPLDILRSCLLTVLLFLGPLFELIFVEKAVTSGSGRLVIESLSSWQGYRNFIAGPITEEVIFRSVLVPIHLLAKISPSKIVFLTPLYFSIAHVHHFYEFTLTHPHTPLMGALLRSLFQFGYTTIFGWLATFIFVRTGSLYSCIIIHTLCNWIGLPRFWGRLKSRQEAPLGPIAMRGKEDSDLVQPKNKGGDLGAQWTVAYYVLLFAGAGLFYSQLWSLTVSAHSLAPFGPELKAKQPKGWF